ncbi:MAG: Zn-dependent hydrolase [Eudoraea sp.]|nr:Zn-dependent hydrolase [Eudoraea sp.]NNJ39299.1 Zn-dependent hydrolase [Eudoraea sp.]
MLRLFIIILLAPLCIQPIKAQSQILVNQDRLESSLLELAQFGIKENGETNRVAFSDADIAARDFVIKLMREVGMDVSIDFAGNIVGTIAGKDPKKKPLAFGSHIDMVPDGGNYDGCVGSMAAIEVVRTLKENGITTSHPLEVLIFSNEEGGVMGSRALAGALKPQALSVVNSTGFSMGQGIQRIGGDTTRLSEVVRPKESLAAFLELHIEQGGILDRENQDIGVVEGIVGLRWWDVRIKGMANHAGTTPMNMRQDALLAGAKFVQAVNEEALKMEGKQVATVGRIRAYPGAPNVIPGSVELSLEIRDLSDDVIDTLYENIRMRAKTIAANSGTQFEFMPLDTTGKPALTATWIQEEIGKASDLLGLSHRQLQSGAGHDAQDMALICPVGMIFVPSKGGISHSPQEFTSAREMANGANVLLHTLLQLDALVE